jgi:hypothetical protein
MKKLWLLMFFLLFSGVVRAQQNFLSYEDFTYIITNNLQKADDFMQSKGYDPIKKKLKAGNKAYTKNLNGGTTAEVEIRNDGKRVYIYLTTNEQQQYNVITSSITPYITGKELVADVQTYHVKNLGDIYIMINDTIPYSPIRKDYDIRIVSDKNITTYN